MKRSPKNPSCPEVEADASAVRKSVRKESGRFLTAADPAERLQAADAMLSVWKELRKSAEEAGFRSGRFDQVEAAHMELRTLARENDAVARKNAIDVFTHSVERLASALGTIGTPAEPAVRWRPEKAPLEPAEKEKRLEGVRTKTRGAARSMADAIRKVVAVRQAQGVPLYSTYSDEVRAMYAVAATDYSLGLVPMAPLKPGTTPQTAPWGVFKVRSAVPPQDVELRFAASPPLPVRTELLESRFGRIVLGPLHPPAGPAGGNNAGG